VHDQGVPQVKIKIGESSGSNPGRELARVTIARSEIGPDVEQTSDRNWTTR
jgi:L-alanine-DL-glutamate epimerase-like enolase superfamily enzyme